MSAKVALITGAARGIGKAIATTLAKDGFNVAITDLSRSAADANEVVKGLEALGVKSVFIAADSSKKDDLVNAVNVAHEKLGGFDVMINNAGICTSSPILESTFEEYRALYDINVAGALFGIQAAATKFLELGQTGKIVNACSVAGQEAFPMLGLYSGSKFAVKGLTQAAAKELAPRGITVNAYCPGITLTPMWADIEAKLNEVTGASAADTRLAFLSQIAMGRGAEPQDIANLVSFLASERSDYVNGQAFNVDGGLIFT